MTSWLKCFFGLICLLVFFVHAPVKAEATGGKNFRFHPLGLLIGLVGVELDFAINENWTLGPELGYWHWRENSDSDPDFRNLKAVSVGARANWFNSGLYKDGWYVGPSANYVSVEAEFYDVDDSVLTAKASGLSLSVLAGYGWFWQSFNQMLGIGATARLGDTEVEVKDSNGEKKDIDVPGAGIALEYTLGWTF